MREVAAALTGDYDPFSSITSYQTYVRDSGMKLTKAYSYLAAVKEHKRVIPFRRFSGGVGRASQAKEFKATQGAFDSIPISVLTEGGGRSLAREIREVHLAPAEERRIECGCEEPGTRRPLHQEHRGPTSSCLSCSSIKHLYSLTLRLENPPTHIPCTWSYQSLPRTPYTC